MKTGTITIAARQITGGLVLAALLLRPVPVRATCVGDCDSQGQVTVDEILTLVNMALGTGGSCAGGITSGTAVNVALIIQAVDNALNGCPVNREDAAISRALATRQCLDFQGLRICPAGESISETPTPGSSPTATPVGAPSIDTDPGNATSIDCFQAVPGGSCTFTLQFVPHAFPSDTTFKVLSRADASSNPWVLGADPVPGSGSEASSYDATLVLTSAQGGPPAQVQLAILAFAATPPSAPTEVQQLHETAATFAFVTQVLAVNVVTPTMTPTPTGKPTNTPRPTSTRTPTSTPGANDCCQCPSSCAAPVDGACGSCTMVFGAACYGELLCVLRTPTPTATPSLTPTPCLKDNSDGTITDGCTGLVWEKKDQAGGLHHYNTGYTWAGVCTDNGALCQPNAGAAAACAGQTGGAVGCSQCASGTCVVDPSQTGALTTIWDWLYQLNSSVFAGYSDWRIPSVGYDGGRPELETILAAPYPCTGIPYPCVSAPFNTDCAPGCTVASCSCTGPFWYWSATTYVADPFAAWSVAFADGRVGTYSLKTSGVPGTGDLAVRAVRGGS